MIDKYDSIKIKKSSKQTKGTMLGQHMDGRLNKSTVLIYNYEVD